MKEVPLDIEVARLAQIVAEDTYSKSNIRRNIKEHINKFTDAALPKLATELIDMYLQGKYYPSKEARLDHIRHIDPEELMLEVMVVMCPLTTATTIQVPAASIASRLEYPDIFDGVKTAAELITMCAMARLVYIHPAGTQEDSIAVSSVIPPDQELFNWLEKVRYPNPMVCPPENWNSNTGGGYITSASSILLGKHNHHEDFQAVDALNIQQNSAWELDQDVLKEDELPKKMPKTSEEARAFLQMARISRQVYKELGTDPFWFQLKYDFRGRAYTSGYYVNLQSTSYKKSLLNFVKKEHVQC